MNSNAHEYKVNATKVALHLLREPDIFETNMKLFCAKDLEDAFFLHNKYVILIYKLLNGISSDSRIFLTITFSR